MPDCVTHEAGDIVNIQSFHELGSVSLDCLHTHAQLYAYLPRPTPLGDELEDLKLPACEFGTRFPRGHAPRRHLARDLGAEV